MVLLLWIFLVVAWVHYSVQQINWCDPKYECNGEKHTMCIYKMEDGNDSCTVFLVQYSVQQINWCDPQNECKGEKHTMCKYKMEAAHGKCKGMVNATDSESQERLLGMHNYVRNYIAAGNVPGWPEASNMRQLTWDDTCADVALRWAFQCQNTRDKCRKTPDFTFVGQNFGLASNDKEYPDGVFLIFKGWIDEITSASGSIVGNFKPNAQYGRFAAIVWAETYKFGCGLVNLTYTGTSFKQLRQVLVCNYAPAGNADGKEMWTKGDPCTNCPNGTKCNPDSTYRNLCALPDDPSAEISIPIDIPSCESCRFNFMSSALLASSVIFKTSKIT